MKEAKNPLKIIRLTEQSDTFAYNVFQRAFLSKDTKANAFNAFHTKMSLLLLLLL